MSNITITSSCLILILVAIMLTIAIMYLSLNNPFKSGFTSLVLLLSTLIGSAFGSDQGGRYGLNGDYQPIQHKLIVEAYQDTLVTILVSMVICLVGILASSYIDQRKVSG